MNRIMNKLLMFLLLLPIVPLHAQEDKEAQHEAKKALQASKNLTYEGNEKLTRNNFVMAEADYRKAISKSGENVAAPYNLGRAYYNRESYTEAFGRFKTAGEKAGEKAEKHKAYHNLGNVFMKQEDYAQAVEAYKQALRANPNDDETRYNLALAKKKQEQDKQDKNDDENKDQNKDDQNKDQDQDNEGDNDKKNDGKDNKEQGDNEDKGNEKPEENKEGEGEKKNEEKQSPKQQGEEKDDDKNPRPNQLSKQQVQNLLEAMQNEEKKVQEKLNAQKVRGAKIKNEKDW